MAETILLGLGKFVLGQLGSVVIQEVKSSLGAEDELDRIKSNLSSIQAVLKDAEKQQSTSESVKNWLGKLQDVMYDIDDLLDDIATEVTIQDRNKGKYDKQVRKFFSRTNFLVLRWQWANQIKFLCKKLDRIASERNSLVLLTEYVDSYSSELWSRETHSKIHNSELVLGRDQDKEAIINSILDCGDFEALSVLPIVGFGGLGKTTLAQLIFNDSRIGENFDLKLWVYVSDKYNLKTVCNEVISRATGKKEKIKEQVSLEQLRIKIKEALGDKKYFLVLDDMWNEDSNEWRKLRELLDVGAKGSMVVVTTRDSKVASIVQSVEDAYQLGKLSNETCLEIFHRLAFKDGGKIEPKLLDLANKIVEKSRGLPLIVTTLGRLLCGQTDEKEWCRVVEKLEQGHEDILNILKLSYDHLSSNCKLCFRVSSVYPKGTELNGIGLFLLWKALGFLPFGEEGEALGRRCLKELFSKSLYKYEDHSLLFDDVFNSIEMHDFVYDLAKVMAGEELTVIDDSTKEIFEKVRYIRVDQDEDVLERHCHEGLLNQAKKARFLGICSTGKTSLSKTFLENIFSRLPCLRALDLTGRQFKKLPRSIGYLKHLRYLDMEGNMRIKRLPNSICNLINLQTLILDGCNNLEEIPTDIGRLENLEMLCLTTLQRELPESIGHIKGLRMLTLRGCPRLAFLPMSTKQLQNLESLLITDCKEVDLAREPCSLDLNSIRILLIKDVPKFKKLSMGDKEVDFTSLQCLFLGGCEGLIELADRVKCFTSLRVLKIDRCPQLRELPHTLHNLQKFIIDDCPILSERCAPEKGDDWHLISNIPYIRIDQKVIKDDT